MPIKIAPKVVEDKKKVTLSLPVGLLRNLDLYARYLGGATDRLYVMEQILSKFLEQDRGFQRWLESDSQGVRE